MNLYAIPNLACALACFGTGVFVLTKNCRSPVNVTFTLLALGMFTWQLGTALLLISVTPEIAYRWSRFAYVGVTFIPVTAYHFITTFVGEERAHKKVIRLGYSVVALIFLPLSQTPYLLEGVQHYTWGYWFKAGVLHASFPIFFGVLMFMGLQLLYRGFQREISGSERTRRRYLFIAIAISCIGSVDFLPDYGFSLYPFGYLPVFVCISILAYAIVRHRLMNINLAVTRTALFALVYALVLGLPLLAALVWQVQIEGYLGNKWWVWLWGVCAALATAAHYVNLYFQRRAEEQLLAEQRRYQTVLRQAAQGMTLIKEMGKLLNLIVHILTRTVRITHAAVYLLDKEAKVYVLRARRGGPEKGQSLEAESPLIKELIRQKGAIVQEEMKIELQGGGGPVQLQGAEGAMGAIRAAVIVPSFVEEKLIGFLVLGEKRLGQMYSQDDLQVFEVLASQAALAIENAQFYDELQRTQADLFQTAKMATLGQMAGGMSHQINNRFYVLTILAGTMKAALAAAGWDGVSPELKELVEKSKVTFQKIEDNAIRGGDIVKTLLRFSRPSRGDQKPVSVQEIVETALDVVQYKIKLEDLDFSKDYEPDLPLIQGNVNQLADSLFNLFSNAYDAIQSKQERLKPPDFRGSIAVTVRTVQGRVQLTIRDNGIGMSPQEVSQLFIPFFTTKATSEKGTGLGLFVIKRIVEHHGGQIQATSQFGEGTAFIITLPAAQQAQAVA